MEALVNNKLLPVLELLNYSINDAVNEFVFLKIHNKISEYKNEMSFYNKKLGKTFSEFEEYINGVDESENIDEYNDYLAWKFANDSLNYYKQHSVNL